MTSLGISMALAAAAPIGLAQPLGAKQAPLAGPAVVVLWASWCVSCRTELSRLPHLAGAAAPLPVMTLAIDPPARALAVLRERGQPVTSAYADVRSPRTVLDAWGGPGSVLPVAVAIDRQGRICGRKLGLLGTDQLREWAARCLK